MPSTVLPTHTIRVDRRRKTGSIPGARLFVSDIGSHLSMWDDQLAYFRALVDFQ